MGCGCSIVQSKGPRKPQTKRGNGQITLIDLEDNMGSFNNPTDITILHFNDVYNIEQREQEPCGGAARFVTAVKQRNHLNPLVLFSGDAFNPSAMSTLTKGTQMIPVLNGADVKCAVYGNHDFDHGVDKLIKLAEESTFPWLLSNVVETETEEPLAEGKISEIITWQGKKIGLIGLVEEEWMATLATVDPEDITCFDFVEEGRILARQLKEQGIDYVIALTHMRWPNDTRLAENVEEIDLILGGHDHDYGVRQINGKYVVKSGTDFRQMSQVTLSFDKDNQVKVKIEEISVDSSIPEDPAIKDVVDKYITIQGQKMERVLGEIEVELDGRFASIRRMETNIGNFVTDIMLKATDADIALLNSGTLRSDMIHPKGVFKMKDLMAILPMVDPVVVLSISGKQVLAALENSVSQYPKLEGRFPQVSGITFGFDPKKEPGQRVDARFVTVQGQYLDEDRMYRLCTKHYISEGKDGYDVFKQCKVLINDDDGPRLPTIVKNHFESVRIIKGLKSCRSHHRQSIISVNKRKTLTRQMSVHEDSAMSSGSSRSLLSSPISPSSARSSWCKAIKAVTLLRRSSIESIEHDNMADALAPKVEGRILVLDEHKIRAMEEERISRELHSTAISEDDDLETVENW